MIYYEIIIKSNNWPRRINKIKKILKNIMKQKKIFNLKKNLIYHINFILMNDIQLTKFNKIYKKINKPTDVLTFVSDLRQKNNTKEKYCDIMVSSESSLKYSKTNNIDFYDHITHIFVHSILHVSGYRHKKMNDFLKMKNKEIKILNSIGINNPYK